MSTITTAKQYTHLKEHSYQKTKGLACHVKNKAPLRVILFTVYLSQL
jgi:hypothetical protein